MLKTLRLGDFFAEALLINSKKRRHYLVEKRGAWFWLSSILLVFMLVLLMNYISGVNSYASTGYEIKQQQKKLSLLTEKNRQMTLKISEASSIVNIETDLADSNFVSIDSARFVQTAQYSQR